MINERQARILSAVVEEYISSAQPIASKTLVDKFDLGVSPATVRNDMVTLEEAGFLRQPHTSSGRIPTEEGYRFYLDKIRKQKQAPQLRVKLTIKAVRRPQIDFRSYVTQIAKKLVELSGEMVFISQVDGWHTYVGVEKLFTKPEYTDVEQMRALSKVVDLGFDGVMMEVIPRLDDKVHVWIGDENPFGSEMATVMAKYHTLDAVPGVLGMVGPLRMDYSRNIRLLSQAKTLLDKVS